MQPRLLPFPLPAFPRPPLPGGQERHCSPAKTAAPNKLPAARPPAAIGVLALHLALLALLLQSQVLERVLPAVLPVSVTLLPAPEQRLQPPAAQPLPAAAPAAAPAMSLTPPPVLTMQPALQVPAPAQAAAPAPEPLRNSEVGAANPATDNAPAARAAPPAPPAPPAEPRLIPAGAISYRVPPAVAVPVASRRLRESGTAWLRVRVDKLGMPVQVSLYKSSGYPRLDEQALGAMQSARFTPQTENGQPIEWVVIAPLAYEID